MANLSKTTKDHDEIQRWAEERGGKPSHVKSTSSEDEVGILRIDFPGFSGQGSLEEISWDDWFEKFDAQNLALVYQEETADGERSNFNKLVSGDSVDVDDEEDSSSTPAKKSSSRGSKKAAVKKTASKSSSRGVTKKVVKKVPPPAKKTVASKKTASKAAPAKKAPAKKAVAKKAPAKKAATKKAPATKTSAKKTAKKPAAKNTSRRGR